MILVLGGTLDGRKMASVLESSGFKVICSVTSAYGGDLLHHDGIEDVIVDCLDENKLVDLVATRKIVSVIDATHPYAIKITQMARQVCGKLGIAYFRYKRPSTHEQDIGIVHHVKSYEDAAILACNLGKTILTTTGSNHLQIFVEHAITQGCRTVARVLPDVKVIEKCRLLGLSPKDILAIQGPFTRQLNRELFLHAGAEVIVTKESGDIGGFLEKVQAATDLNIPMVVISRPQEFEEVSEVACFDDMEKLLQEVIRSSQPD